MPDESYVKVIALFRAGISANQSTRRMSVVMVMVVVVCTGRAHLVKSDAAFHQMINSCFSTVSANYVAHKCLSYLNMALER